MIYYLHKKNLKSCQVKEKELAYRPSHQADIPSSSSDEEFILLCSACTKHTHTHTHKRLSHDFYVTALSL